MESWEKVIKTKTVLEEKKEEEELVEKEKNELNNVIDFVEIEEFKKIDLRVGEVIKAENIEKSNKLIKLIVDLGPLGQKQIIAGIKAFYSPESLLNKKL